MAACFRSNIFLCYLPAHCSHGLQPLDNGVFNALKAFYRRELGKLASLMDSAPVDKISFIQCLARAREAAFTLKNIQAGWRVTGNWPISRWKALKHPEIQEERPQGTPEPASKAPEQETPRTSRQIKDMAVGRSPGTRRSYSLIARGFEFKETELVTARAEITALKGQLERLTRSRKRKKVPNPNKRFMELGEILASGGEAQEVLEVVEESEEEPLEEPLEDPIAVPIISTRSGRAIKRPRKYDN